MKKVIYLVAATLLISGVSFAQDDMKKDAKAAHKEMKQDAKAMKKDAKQTGDAVKVDAAKDMKHMHKTMKKTEKKVTNP